MIDPAGSRAILQALGGWLWLSMLVWLPVPSHAADETGTQASGLIHAVRVGIMAHDVGGLLTTRHQEPGIDFGMEGVLALPIARLCSGMIRPNLGFTWNSRHETSKVYSGLVWHRSLPKSLSIELAFGGALHNGERNTRDPDKKELGSKLLFRSAIEIGWQVSAQQQVSLLFEHISNAGLANENEGMDLIGVRWAWRF